MKQFSALEWLNKNAINKQTKVTIAGMKCKLGGIPNAFTDEELAVLASRQTEHVRVTVPKVETVGGLEAGGSGEVTGETLSQLIVAQTGIGKETGKNRLNEKATV